MNDRMILITGTSSGIGKATVERFARGRWTVLAAMRGPERAAGFDWPENVHPLPVDVNDPGSVDALRDTVLEQWGCPDVLVNNAGYPVMGPVEETDDGLARDMFETNVFGLLRVTRAFLPAMRDRGSGRIMNISSVGGEVVFPFYSVYQATKHAVEAISAGLWLELRPFGIRVNSIQPGVIRTEFYRGSLQLTDGVARGTSSYQGRFDRFIAMQERMESRGVPPEKVAATIWRVAGRSGGRLAVAADAGARALIYMRRLLPESLFFRLVHLATRRGG